MDHDAFPRETTAWAMPGLRRYSVIYGLIAICVLIEGILTLGDWGVFPFPRLRQTVYEYGGFWPGLWGPWKPNYPLQPVTMIITHAFLHGGPLHLIFNMITLASCGAAVADRVGQRGFLAIFVAAVIGGALGYGVLTNMPNPMVGASGGLFGLVGALLAWNFRDRLADGTRTLPVFRAVIALTLLNLVIWWLMDGHLAWQTHLGGFVFGWLIALKIDHRGKGTGLSAPTGSGRKS